MQRIEVFTSGSNAHFAANWWDGSRWNWNDQGIPPGETGAHLPNAITYFDTASGGQKLYVFGIGSTTNLIVNWWSGGAWNWLDLGSL